MRPTSPTPRIVAVLASSGLLMAGACALAPSTGFADNTTCTPVTVGSIANLPSGASSTSGSGGCSSSGTTVDNSDNAAGTGADATSGDARPGGVVAVVDRRAAGRAATAAAGAGEIGRAHV